MESLQSVQQRLAAVKNVGKITKAMEVVAATKMRKAQEIALASRPYALLGLGMLEHITKESILESPLATPREVKKTLLVVISSDRGLAGSLNAQVFRSAEKVIRETPSLAVVAIGKKALQFAEKNRLEVAAHFSGYGDFIEYAEIEPAAETIISGFENGIWDRVITVSTHFRTTLKQETLVRELLPARYASIRETINAIRPEHGRFHEISMETENRTSDYIFEPSREVLLSALIPYLIKLQVFHIILEANASEHSSRMVAMKTASDNANDLASSLRLLYNKARQAGITQEMVEIISTQNAL